MQLVEPLDSHLLQMMGWFSNEQDIAEWAGPNFRYPFDLSTFKADLKLADIRSYALVLDDNTFLGFGQYYLRLNRCHLGRIVIDPNKRGLGIVAELISQLCIRGESEIKTTDFSLFVLSNNTKGIKAYQKSGFVIATYPDTMPLENCLYMLKSVPR